MKKTETWVEVPDSGTAFYGGMRETEQWGMSLPPPISRVTLRMSFSSGELEDILPGQRRRMPDGGRWVRYWRRVR